MPERVSKEETRTSSRQDEKLRAIKDLKMPMARFRNGILIGQARQFIPGTSAPKELKEPDRRWDKKEAISKPLQCSRWLIMLVIVAFPGFIMKITDWIQFFKKKKVKFRFPLYTSLKAIVTVCAIVTSRKWKWRCTWTLVMPHHRTPSVNLAFIVFFDQWILKGNKSFSTTPQQHGDKAKGDKRSHVLECIKSIPHKKIKRWGWGLQSRGINLIAPPASDTL